MKREEKIAMCEAYYDALCDGASRARARAFLTDDPAQTAPGDPRALSGVRPVLRWFAWQMENVLRANDHKGGWQDMTADELLDRLDDEVKELRGEVANPRRGNRFKVCIKEAADVANFAMMLADYCRTEPLAEETMPGDPRALALADFALELAKWRREDNDDMLVASDEVADKIDEIAAILRRAPKQENVPGSPRALELAQWYETDPSCLNISQRADVVAILRRASGPDLDALEKAMREWFGIGRKSDFDECFDAIEAAIAEMRSGR